MKVSYESKTKTKVSDSKEETIVKKKVIISTSKLTFPKVIGWLMTVIKKLI